ncbi:MAG: hypothetical protein JWO44_898 [Bacteroidetes bacterium]|nr:hypothetical protein [Bacteroidota bacterium]
MKLIDTLCVVSLGGYADFPRSFMIKIMIVFDAYD